MRKVSLFCDDDQFAVKISKKKEYDSDMESPYDIKLNVYANLTDSNPTGASEMTISHIKRLNHVFKMLGLETLFSDDEQLLTEFIATRGDLGRESVDDNIRSSGIMLVSPGSVTIFGTPNSESGKNSADDSNGRIIGKDINEVLAKVMELNPQQNK